MRLTPEERVRWEKEFARLNRSYEFHLTFALQAVAFFYAAVGGVLSIYFSGSGRSKFAITLLLFIPIAMSLILGGYLLHGAFLQREDAKYMHQVTEKLEMVRAPKVELLTKLLVAFSFLYFITSIALSALLSHELGYL